MTHHVSRIRSLLLTATIVAATLLSPIIATAQDETGDVHTYDDITFTNPSAVTGSHATPVAAASPWAEATPVASAGWHGGLLGDPDAPVTLQIYADYQCPHCRNFNDTIEPLLIDDYVRSGMIRLEFIDFPVIGISSLDELTDDSKVSVQAAEATMCAGEQDAYMAFRETLYQVGESISPDTLSDSNLVSAAQNMGLDGDSLETCLTSGRYEKAVITGMLSGIDKGVQGTPTMMVNGNTLQPATYSELQELLNEAIEATR